MRTRLPGTRPQLACFERSALSFGVLRYVTAFSSEPMMLSFSKHLCHAEGADVAQSVGSVSSIASSLPTSPCNEVLRAGFAGTAGLDDIDPYGGRFGMGALPEMHTFCEAVLFESLALEKAEVLPAYLQLYHLAATLTQIAHSLPVYSVRILAAYYTSPALTRMRDGLTSGNAASEPLLQASFVHSLCVRFDALLSPFSLDAKPGPRAQAGIPASAARGPLPGTPLCEEQWRILHGAFLAQNGVCAVERVPKPAQLGRDSLASWARTAPVANPFLP